MKKKSLFLLSSTLLLSLVTTMSACSTNDEPAKSSNPNPDSSYSAPTSEAETVNVASISITNSENHLNVGSSLTLGVSVLPSNATNKSVTYSSSDPSVLSVNEAGLVNALKEGSATITATSVDGGKTSSISLRVIKEGYSYMNNANEMGEALAESEYQSQVVGADKYGLSAPDAVGVDSETSKSILYAPSADDQYDEVIVANELTLSDISAVLPGAAEINGYTMIQGAINLTKKYNDEGKTVKIKLPSGKIDVDTTNVTTTRAFVLDGLNGTAIEGNNTIINVQIAELNYKGYMYASNCKNLTIYGIRFTEEVGANVTGTVESYDLANWKATIKIDKAYNETMKRVVKAKKSLRSYLEFHKVSKVPLQNGNFAVDNFSSTNISENNGEYTVVITFKSAINESQLGTLASLQFAQYDVHGITISDSENVYLESLTMNKSYGMGVTADGVKNLYLNRFNLTVEEGSKDLMTSCADATHFSMLTGEVKFTNSIIEYSHDDALNIKHGYWYKLDEVVSRDRQFTLSKITSEMSLPKAGDKIAVYNEETFEGYGTYTVTGATLESGKMVVTVKERPAQASSWGNARVTFLADTPTFIFQNNIVRNKRNRGILIQVPNAIIENNTFKNVGHGSIQAGTSMDRFNEATLPQEITIRNNKFINNNYLSYGNLYGDVSIFAIANNGVVAPKGTLKNCSIENNYFTENGNSCVSLRGVSNSEVKDCFFYNASSSQPSGDPYNCLFSLSNTGDLTIEGSYNQYNLGNGLSGIIPQGSTSDEDVTLKDNQNIAFQVIDDVGPEVDVSKATGEITIDGKLDEWDSIGATDIEIRGITDALGAEWNASQLESTFKVNKLKMTYNDKGIYLAFDIFDDKIDCKTINDFWLGDCVEVLASTITNKPNADLSVYKEEGGVIQAAFAPTWASSNYSVITEVRSNSEYVKNKNLLEAKLLLTDSGYTGEVLFPFTLMPEFKTAIDEGKRIDFAIIVADSERPAHKRIQEGNVAHNVEGNKTMTARMPQYLFN